MNTAIRTRALLPLASLTAVGMLATDLYLPAVPSLPLTLGGTLEQAQYTLSVFLGALAIGQILWGWTSDRYGESFTISVGTALLILSSFACALAPSVEFLILARIVQGLGAGAPTVAVPSLVRKKFSEVESVKALGVIASIEAIVPALGPILGAGLIAISHWRTSFWLLGLVALLLVPFFLGVVREHKGEAPTTRLNYLPLFRNFGFLRFSLSYAIMFGALILLVMTAPQLIVSWFNLEIYYFSILQVADVSAFIILARSGGHLAEKKGMAFVIRLGVVLQTLSCLGMVAMGLTAFKSIWLLTVLWCGFCAGLALRGPSTMTRALSYAGEMAGKGSGLMMFLAFGTCSVAVAAIASYLRNGFTPVALTMLIMVVVSALLSGRVQSTIA